MNERPKRPIGISILSVLLIAGSSGLLLLQVAFRSRLADLGSKITGVGLQPLSLIVGVVFLGVLGLVSGIGMWRGSVWGWRLGSFYFLYGVARNIAALIAIGGLFADPSLATESSRGAGYYYGKHALRAAIDLLLYLYFFRANVLDYFGLGHSRLGRSVALGIIACVVTTIIASVASAL